jgi:Na+-transporting NADH:ubiquinone oxidoreductase subunit A
MAVVRSRRGLDLPLAGAPSGTIEAARMVSSVALLGPDFPGLKPALQVEVGDRVQLGQALIEDKQRPGVRYTAPAGGTVTAIHRGERRALVSIVIAVDDSIAAAPVTSWGGPGFRPDGAAMRALLLESGLWTLCARDPIRAWRRPMRNPPPSLSRPWTRDRTRFRLHW